MVDCFTGVAGRRKIFWTTQLSCDVQPGCVSDCGVPGLAYVTADGTKAETSPLTSEPITISNAEWISGLVLNILMTNGKQEDRTCGFRPGQQGGHWTDSYRGDSNTAGSLIRQVPTNISIKEAVLLIGAYAELALKKLIEYEVAATVDVTSSYAGDGIVSLLILIQSRDGTTSKVGMTAARLENSWAWRTQ